MALIITKRQLNTFGAMLLVLEIDSVSSLFRFVLKYAVVSSVIISRFDGRSDEPRDKVPISNSKRPRPSLTPKRDSTPRGEVSSELKQGCT